MILVIFWACIFNFSWSCAQEKQTLVGRVNIPVESVIGRTLVEKWYPVEGASKPAARSGGSTKDNLPSLRVKSTFQSVHILPVNMYHEFHQVSSK